MSNDFFNDHPLLGSMFDFNHDGSMNLGEAGAMGAFGSMAASELMRATEETEREYDYASTSKKGKRKKKARDYCFDDDYDDDFVEYDENKVFEVDVSDVDEVMEAITSGDFDEADVEYLVGEALCSGVKFDKDDAEEILEIIKERDLRVWLKSTVD